jgi:hypothetical protein
MRAPNQQQHHQYSYAIPQQSTKNESPAFKTSQQSNHSARHLILLPPPPYKYHPQPTTNNSRESLVVDNTIKPCVGQMPHKIPNPHKRKASPKIPPDPTPDQLNEGTVRINVKIGTTGPISSANLLKVVPRPRALGGYYKKKHNIPLSAPSPLTLSQNTKASATPPTGNWSARDNTFANWFEPQSPHTSSSTLARVSKRKH